jgi:uncharacterized protein YihD (DUF1040 family)
MRDPERIDRLLAKLEKLWQTSPDLRLGQLLYHVISNAQGGPMNLSRVVNIEDDSVEASLERALEFGWYA